VVEGCTDRNRIIQKDCRGASDALGGKPLVRSITSDSITGVLTDHLLPDSDRDKILHFARGSVRARFFAELIVIIQKAPHERTPADDELVDYYAHELQALRIEQAQVAEAEYARYESMGQCGYVPPEPFTFEWPSACFTPFGIFDPTPKHPTLEEFKAYGYAAVTKDLTEDHEASAVATDTGRAIAFGIGAAAAAVITVGAFFFLSTTVIGISIVTAVFPFVWAAQFWYAGWVMVWTSAAGFVSGFLTTALGFAGAIGIVLFGVIFVAFSFVDLFDYNTFVDKVTHQVEIAESTTPDLRHVILEPGTGMSELYYVVLNTTLPEFPPTATVPAASACDPKFAIRDAHGASLGTTDTISLMVPRLPEAPPTVSIEVKIGLRGGWFAVETSLFDEANPAEPPTVVNELALKFVHLAWDHTSRDTWRRGSGFLSINPEDVKNNTLDRSRATDSFEYLDADAQLRSASLVFDESASCADLCPDDPDKTRPGACGCGVPDDDVSGDGEPDCFDACPDDPTKSQPGCNGCGVVDPDADGDGTADCFDACPDDPAKTGLGECGCGEADIDSDGDGTLDCRESCPDDPDKTLAGACGCGTLDDDTDGDGLPGCVDNCPGAANADQADLDGDGAGDVCDDDDDNDGLTDQEERDLGTELWNVDTDGDGLSDGDEVKEHGTDPLNTDTDGDGLTDGEEVETTGTDPLDADSDDDGLDDGLETEVGTDPLDADSDDNGIVDGQDVEFIQNVIDELPPEAFNNGAKGVHNALRRRLKGIERRVEAGHIKSATRTLRNLMRRMDGCGEVPHRNDWIVDCPSQVRVRELLDLLLSNLDRG
jgi:hypothetical protein